MKHQFRQRLRSGALLVGTIATLGYPEVAEILTAVGFDWLFLDAEHGTFEAPTMQRFLQGAGPNMPCLVRISASEEVPIKKALDVGAAGIIAPMVNSAEQAEQVVRLSKYAPLGTRGVGVGRAHGYGLSFQEYVQRANEDVSVVIQAEHIEAVENIEAIVQVPGIDAVLIGPYDLSASLGRLGQVDHPEVVSAVDRVTQACQRAGVPLGIFGMSAKAVRPYIERGYTLIVVGIDAMLLGTAAEQLLAQVKVG
jgi:2-keto-3-deoxy-L-rhamnonate aldolase RhmA